MMKIETDNLTFEEVCWLIDLVDGTINTYGRITMLTKLQQQERKQLKDIKRKLKAMLPDAIKMATNG